MYKIFSNTEKKNQYVQYCNYFGLVFCSISMMQVKYPACPVYHWLKINQELINSGVRYNILGSLDVRQRVN